MRWRPPIAWVLVAALLAPPTIYEALEKTSERIGPQTLLLSLSARANQEEPWRSATGARLVDRALHELGETQRFYRMVFRHVSRSRR